MRTTAPHPACDFNDTGFSLRRRFKMPGSTYARVQLYEVASWQRTRAESIIHTGANKGNNVRRATVTCAAPPLLRQPPPPDAAASLPASGQPAVVSQPHATPETLPLLPLWQERRRKQGLNMQAKLQAAGPTLRLWIKDCSSWAFAVIDVCHIIHRLNKCIPPPPTSPYYIFNTAPLHSVSPCPLLCLSPKALPSCCVFNARAPRKKRRHLARALQANGRKGGKKRRS